MNEMLITYKSHLTNELLAVGAHCNKQHMELNQTFEQLEDWAARTWAWELRPSKLKPGKRSGFGEYQTGDDESAFREYDRASNFCRHPLMIVELSVDGRQVSVLMAVP